MAQWQIMKNGAPLADAIYDDGETLQPGDNGFSNTAALTRATANGGDTVNYVGPSPQPVQE